MADGPTAGTHATVAAESVALELHNVCKNVAGEVHLADISLAVEPGSLTVLLGHTLAGKTSLLRIIAGLDRPTSGRISLDGVDITRTTVRKRSVAMVYQQFVNYPSFTVRQNIASPLRLMRARNIDERVRELAERLRIAPYLDRLPETLSGGQQQRVAIARALAKGADFLLLDEPLVNLDYKLREQLRDELRAIFAERDMTVLYATSEPDEALAMGGDTVVMHQGRVLQHAPALVAYHRPASVDAALVFSDPPMNVFAATISEKTATVTEELRIPLPEHLRELDDGRYQLAIRASDCTLGDANGAGCAVPVPAVVEVQEISGSETFAYLRHGGLRFVVRETGVFHRESGRELTFYINPDKLLAFELPPDAASSTAQ